MRADDILLLDMLLSAREAISFMSGLAHEEFERDRMRQLAVIKSIEIIGEAADRISEEFCSLHPEIPWRDIIAMRHRLVHGYFEIDLTRLWDTVEIDLPPLVKALEKLTPPDGES